MPRYRIYVEVVRGYHIDIAGKDEDDALYTAYNMDVGKIASLGELTYCDTGEHAEIVEELNDDESNNEEETSRASTD